jgi:hypothetical protein
MRACLGVLSFMAASTRTWRFARAGDESTTVAEAQYPSEQAAFAHAKRLAFWLGESVLYEDVTLRGDSGYADHPRDDEQ